MSAYPAGNGECTVDFVKKLLKRNQTAKLLLIWDGSSYHRGQEMQLFLAGQNSGLSPQEWQITCELFAPYAPEENPCQWYKKIFPEVRSFEAFKYLHVGMISEIKRKTLPEIARLVGLSNEQGLLHS